MTTALGLALPVLRLLSPEAAHGLTLKALKAGLVAPLTAPPDPALRISLWGLDFPNPVGLAAGFDKNAEVFAPLLKAGFGFVECGTVTPRAQAGNPRPRIFRLPADRAVINRLGFNNGGLDPFVARLSARLPARGAGAGPVGANLGANKDTEDRAADYVQCLEAAYPYADYVTINVSSPNTPGLRQLQDAGALRDLLARLQDTRARLAGSEPPKPLLLKVAPDLNAVDVFDIAQVVIEAEIDGLIVSNTTIARPDTLRGSARGEAGGLSGAPLFERSTTLISDFHRATQGRVPIIGVGGISNADQAYAKIKAGASLVQLYTALVYKGPGLVAEILTGLSGHLQADGFTSVSQAVGTSLRSV